MQQQKQQPRQRTKERFLNYGEFVHSIIKQISLLNWNQNRGWQSCSITLDQAAELVDCPRKTLEDYYYLLRKAETLVNLEEKKNEKMGYIRKLCKENRKQNQEIKLEEEIYQLNKFQFEDNIHDD
ncbi:unnamed protein product [Paramecium octaurelia]|uniref:Uncharacterized protein n=1 Tax=Paramecium octaurelia TaxID=43137 RepID=A0A8S1V0H6_PAROT|nr:unnamed protein product [Paramecium octaurelia]